jgi:NADH dehydrogenase
MHTVIVGGGIAGIKAAREISRRGLGKVTLISQNPEFVYHSMLYAAAMGDLSGDTVALDVIFAGDSNVEVVVGVLEDIDIEHKQVVCADTAYKYDSLILAPGASINYFDVPGADRYSFSIETIKKANELRRHIHDDIAIDHKFEKQYVIVGGGLTGVELAGAIGAYIHKVAAAHGITKGNVRVMLVEQEERLLPLCSRTASNKAMRRLKKLGVTVRLGHRVDSLTGEYVVIDGKKIPTGTVVWTCGSRGNALFLDYPHLFKTAEDGRVMVDGRLQAHDNIYVIGDSAALPYGGRVSSALREASYVARYLDRKMHKQPTRAYKPSRSATYLRIGSQWAYVERYGIYAAGATGYVLFRLHERFILEQLLPDSLPGVVLHAASKSVPDCGLCDT